MAQAHHSSEGERGVMVGMRQLPGQSTATVANHPTVHYGERTVGRWFKRYEEEGYDGLKTRPRSGRPRTVSDEDVQDLRASLLAAPFRTLQEVVLELKPELVQHMKTVYRRVAETKLRARVAAKKPLLTEAQRQARLDFAVANLHRTPEEWCSVVVTDEKSFRSCQTTGKKVWRLPGTRYEEVNCQPRNESGRITAMFYGAVSADHGPLVMVPCPGNMNNEVYRASCLQPLVDRMAIVAGENEPFEFIQDNAGIHRARAVRDWLGDRPHMRALDWPANSPDLNWIENVWGMMALNWEVRFERRPADLEDHVIAEWDWITGRPAILRRLAESMPRRLAEVIEKNGGATHY